MSSNARTRMGAYGRTPKALLRDGRLSARAKIVVAMVDEVAGHEELTMGKLAEWLGCTEATARKAVHEAKAAGWLEVLERHERGMQVASEYIANGEPFQADAAPQETTVRTTKNQEGALPENTRPGTPENGEANRERDERDVEAAQQPKPPRAHRLPEEWEPSPELVAWAEQHAAAVDWRRETVKFVNYWLAKGGREAAKIDWGRTWQNWIMRAEEMAPHQRSSVPEMAPEGDARREQQRLWLEARGSSVEEYDRRKDEPGWFESLQALEVAAS